MFARRSYAAYTAKRQDERTREEKNTKRAEPIKEKEFGLFLIYSASARRYEDLS